MFFFDIEKRIGLKRLTHADLGTKATRYDKIVSYGRDCKTYK